MIYPDLYGAFDIAREYCGFTKFPSAKPSTTDIMWQHGVEYPDFLSIPELVLGSDIPSSQTKILVANKNLKEAIETKLKNKIFIVGLPTIYLPDYKIDRKKNTLLAYPAHSVPGSTVQNHKIKEYAEYLKTIADRFEKIEVCIFGPDFDKKSVFRTMFEDAGFKILRGVDDSKYSLHEQKKRLLATSHVTSNTMGSHIPYAAAFGCKVSIAGPFYEISRENLKNTEFYMNFPNALDIADKYSKESLRNKFPWLFCEPFESSFCKDWGNEHIGANNKLSPSELRSVFNWPDKEEKLINKIKHKITELINLSKKK